MLPVAGCSSENSIEMFALSAPLRRAMETWPVLKHWLKYRRSVASVDSQPTISRTSAPVAGGANVVRVVAPEPVGVRVPPLKARFIMFAVTLITAKATEPVRPDVFQSSGSMISAPVTGSVDVWKLKTWPSSVTPTGIHAGTVDHATVKMEPATVLAMWAVPSGAIHRFPGSTARVGVDGVKAGMTVSYAGGGYSERCLRMFGRRNGRAVSCDVPSSA